MSPPAAWAAGTSAPTCPTSPIWRLTSLICRAVGNGSPRSAPTPGPGTRRCHPTRKTLVFCTAVLTASRPEAPGIGTAPLSPSRPAAGPAVRPTRRRLRPGPAPGRPAARHAPAGTPGTVAGTGPGPVAGDAGPEVGTGAVNLLDATVLDQAPGRSARRRAAHWALHRVRTCSSRTARSGYPYYLQSRALCTGYRCRPAGTGLGKHTCVAGPSTPALSRERLCTHVRERFRHRTDIAVQRSSECGPRTQRQGATTDRRGNRRVAGAVGSPSA